MKDLFWLSWHRTPYNDFLFVQVGLLYSTDLCFLKEKLDSHPWKSINEDLTNVYYQSSFPIDWGLLKRSLQSSYRLRIVTGWNHPQMFLTLTFCALLKRDFAIWTDIPNVNQQRPFFKRILRHWWLSFILSKAKYTLVTGGEVGVEAMLKIGCVREKTRNFPTVVDLEKFKPLLQPKTKASNDPIIFVSSGRLLNSHKGYDVAIRAFGVLKRRQPKHNFRYFIAGTGPDEESLVKLILEQNLQDSVFLLGWVEIEKIIEVYQQADFFIHPSHVDPFPNVVMEAMACGLPVIGSTGAGSVLDRVIENKNGYIFRDNDFLQLCSILSGIFDEPETLGDMRIEARKMAEKWSVKYNLNVLSEMFNALN
jgi:glycosyltransferase involved in cell wall biosynthesis